MKHNKFVFLFTAFVLFLPAFVQAGGRSDLYIRDPWKYLGKDNSAVRAYNDQIERTVNEARRQSAERINRETATGFANVLLLPVLGGSEGDNITLGNLIASLRDINDACNLIDESENKSILPAGFSGFSAEDNELLYSLGVKYRANFVIHSYVQKYGQRNLAIISRYNVYGKRTDAVNYLEYLDPVEAWIKLPGIISNIMNREVDPFTADISYIWRRILATASSADRYVLVRYQDGVDRVEAQRMLNIFYSDFTEITGKSILEITEDFEGAVERRQGVERISMTALNGLRGTVPAADWKTYVDVYVNTLKTGRKFTPPGIEDLINDIGIQKREAEKLMIIEVSRQGNKTRFQPLEGFDYFLDYTDIRDFVRQVRGMSLTIDSRKVTAGYDLGLVQGVKYNYWKYANEDAAIPDILTYIKPYSQMPDVSVESTTSTTITLRSTDPANILFYYSTENKFSKATPVVTRKRQIYNSGYFGDGSQLVTKFNEIYGLKPDTRYYIWATSCWGNLEWLQSQRVIIETRTKAEKGDW